VSRASAAGLLAVALTALVSAGSGVETVASPSNPPVVSVRPSVGDKLDVNAARSAVPPMTLWYRWRAQSVSARTADAAAALNALKARRSRPPDTTTVASTTTVATTTSVATTTTTTRPPAPSTPTGCGGSHPAEMASRGGASQLITVVASDYGTTYATLTAWRMSGSCWVRALGPFEARVGYSGITTDKREGDGATPAGIYDFEPTMYGNAPNPGVHFGYWPLRCGDWWDEDSASPEYNRFVVVPCSEQHPPFDNGASEALWTETAAYPSFAVINYNAGDVPGKGSAIFLHADIGGPTAGCVSLPLGDLDEVLDWMLPADDPTIAIGTTATITSY
jgi:L,D-peptidoglycan transpeptidase YkuD (ErfK/YbiS/YcfS/YnhG family)